MIAAIITLFLFALLGLGSPVGFAMLISAVAGLLWVGGIDTVVGILGSAPYSSAAAFELITIPMFLLMAELVLRSGIANDLFAAAAAWVGRLPGGLGIATAMAGAGFGAICGSSTASAATLSSTSLPAMLKQGYKPSMAAGVVSISGTLAMLIPPSIALVLFGYLSGVRVGKLLIAGVIPGLVVTLTIALTTYFLAKVHPEAAPISPKVPFSEKMRLLKVVWPMLGLMAAVTGVIYTGIATPTEAGAIGCFGAAVLYFTQGKPSWSDFWDAVAKSTRTTCMIAVILIGAHVFAAFFALTQTTQSIVAWVGALPVSPWLVLLVIVAILIVLGTFMDQVAILVLTVPLLVPLIVSLGFDPIWFGVIAVVTGELGLVTPPVGLNCFVVARCSGQPLQDVFAGTLPHVVAHLIAIAILCAFPILTLWLPNMM